MLRPVDPARANGVVLYEVTNRGNKLLGRLNGVVPAIPTNPIELNDPVTAAHAGTGFLFERGLTLVWSGWDPTLTGRNATLTVRFPLALEDGKPMVRRIREEFQVGKRIASSDTIVLTYPAVSLDKSKARLMMRRREGDRAHRNCARAVGVRRCAARSPAASGHAANAFDDLRILVRSDEVARRRHRLCGGARSRVVPAPFAELAAGREQAAPRACVRHLAERTFPAALPRSAHEPRSRRPAGVRRRARPHRWRRQDVRQPFVRRAKPHDSPARGSSLSGGVVSVLGRDQPPIRSAARPDRCCMATAPIHC